MDGWAQPKPRIGLERRLRSRLADRAGGQVLVLDYFTTRRCGVVLGDITARFRRSAPGAGYVELATIESVRTFANERLLPVLTDTAVTLRLGLAGRLGLEMEPASRWIEFLEQPVTAG